ncbi:SemiSWEET transporter [Escherichia coli]|uniref:SemiSWEET transporter n=1 Tax=Escherichia coli TaxID=562 RepID=UPI002490ABA6|nr:SemiSWEET transporter [Escherichia coli]
MDTILLTELFAAFFTTFAFAPQSIKTIRTRNTEGISVVMYIMFLTGVISWIAYGIMRSDFAVLIANIVTLFLAAPVLVITLINRRKKHV